MRILLTRTLSQVQSLQTLLSEQGYQPVLFPTLEIKSLNNKPLKANYDALIFISANAVEYGLKTLKMLDYQSTKVFAVGATTAKKLEEQGIQVDAFPAQKASSEALLAMSELQALHHQSVLIFRGEGGRETLKEGLSKNNEVEYIEVYRRVPCNITPLHRDSLLKFLQSNQGIITATSVENLSALVFIVKQIDKEALNLIKRYPLVVLSERIKVFAQSIGFNQIKVAIKTCDEGLLEAIQCSL
ncbi:Uroporphyrinogen-III synthase (EC [Bathymodiolus brooksi thiotrophic gill symbiont]|nr:Uroporphyrinogen-III synthase (EC [Bathymodiolus brooksi thiotrophic gill symbiont]